MMNGLGIFKLADETIRELEEENSKLRARVEVLESALKEIRHHPRIEAIERLAVTALDVPSV